MLKQKQDKVYALYKGDDFLAVGTIKEIAEQMGVKESTVMCYKTPGHINRYEANGRIAIRVEVE